MDKKNAGLNVPVTGMNRQSFSHHKDERVYDFQNNGNLETDELGGIALTNEHSNILCSRFKPGFKVLKTKVDYRGGKVFFFLVNEQEDTSISEIGYIDFLVDYTEEKDITQSCGCNFEKLVETPLEEIEQLEHCEYKTLISDECNGCLNFSMEHPITSVVIKTEKGRKTMTFTDAYNEARYIVLDDMDRYTTPPLEQCGDEPVEDFPCLDCESMGVFAKYNIPVITAEVIQFGGNLKQGAYTFRIAYSDAMGNEISPYFTPTNKIDIFDTNDRIRKQEELNENTNYSIRLKVNNLDKRFSHYKVVVTQRADINNQYKHVVVGVKPTVDNLIVYSNDYNKTEIDTQSLFAQKPTYKTLGGFVDSNGYLFGYDYTVQKEINLQPIANILGSFLQWQTHQAHGDLYADGVNIEKYSQYMRDENYPFSFRIGFEGGYYTSLFHLVNRPTTLTEGQKVIYKNSEGELITADKNISSIIDNTSVETDRDKYFQYYNTATYEGQLETDLTNGVISTKNFERGCIEKIKELDNQTVQLTVEGIYNNFDDYYEQYEEYILEDREDNIYYNEFLANLSKGESDDPCQPSFPVEICTDNNVDELCCRPYGDPVATNIVNPEIYGEKVINKEERDLVDYKKSPITEPCSITAPVEYREMGLLNHIPVATNREDYIKCMQGHETKHLRMVFFDRYMGGSNFTKESRRFITTNDEISFTFRYLYSNTSEDDLIYNDKFEEITLFKDGLTTNPYFIQSNEVLGISDTRRLEDEKYPCITQIREQNVTKSAVWIDLEINDEEDHLLEISSKLADTSIDNQFRGDDSVFLEIPDMATFANRKIRFQVYDTYNFFNVIYTGTFDIYENKFHVGGEVLDFLRLNKSDSPSGKLSIVLDGYLAEINTDCVDCNKQGALYTTMVPLACFNIKLRPIEYKTVTVEFEKIKVLREKIYRTDCNILVPKETNNGAIPYAYGKLGIFESEEEYPDNSELYNSSNLKITPQDLGEYKDYFENLHENIELNPDGTYDLSNYDLRCKKIRLYKMPNNNISPFIENTYIDSFQKTLIYPLGVKLDKEIINKFLDIAVKNGLLSQEMRDKVEVFEVWRGDRTVHKSVLFKGIASDMYEYEEDNRTVLFRNFPNNTLGENALINLNNKRDGKLLDHPFKSIKNHRFSLIAPEVYYNKPKIGKEVSIEGFLLGSSVGRFDYVEGHPKWVVLGEEAKNLAKKLANWEFAFDVAMFFGEQSIQISQAASGGGFFGISGAISAGVGVGVLLGMSAVYYFQGKMFKINEYESKWLKAFKENGAAKNLASKFSSVSEVNYFKPNTEEDSLFRGINISGYISPGRPNINETSRVNGKYETETYSINNVDRESSLFLSFGKENAVEYPSFYINYDNYSTNRFSASRYIASDVGCDIGNNSEKRAGYPYFSIKNYVPNQYGEVDSMQWIPTGNFSLIDSDKFGYIFGGDTTISKVGFKTKVPLFIADAMQQGDRVPFDYWLVRNFNYPRFYVSYETNARQGSSREAVKFADSVYNLDCPITNKSRDFYVDPPLKFYLQYYNNIDFYVESTLNNNFRYGRTNPDEHFYPIGAASDFNKWTQEEFISIRKDNKYFINPSYAPVTHPIHPYRTLPSTYSKEEYDVRYDAQNGVIWTQQDNSENDLNDPWLIFKPNDKYEFPSSYGRLISMDEIESNQIMARFENQLAIFNAVDVLKDRLNYETKEIGTGGIFASRPAEFSTTVFGDTGSQHRAMTSNEFGHFYTDARRGKVYQLSPNARQLTPISHRNQKGELTNTGKWFQEQLPFKILTQGIEGLEEEHTDNPNKGLGIVMWYDYKFRRVFLTKKDYITKVKGIKYKKGKGFFINNSQGEEQIISLTDENYFEDASWTIAYSPLYQTWVSYYDFHPDYAIEYPGYFQTGLNYSVDSKEQGLWSHLLTKKSFQVFYGKKYPWVVDIQTKNDMGSKVLESISYRINSYRYISEYDTTEKRKKGFNKAIIYNKTNHSGLLYLDYTDKLRYTPQKIENYAQKIAVSDYDEETTFNYFFNRVKNQQSYTPLWNYDINRIHKYINKDAISFKGKRVLERLRGNYFNIRFIKDDDTTMKQEFKWLINKNRLYND